MRPWRYYNSYYQQRRLIQFLSRIGRYMVCYYYLLYPTATFEKYYHAWNDDERVLFKVVSQSSAINRLWKYYVNYTNRKHEDLPRLSNIVVALNWWGYGGGRVQLLAVTCIIIYQLTWPYFYDPNLNNRLTLYYNIIWRVKSQIFLL